MKFRVFNTQSEAEAALAAIYADFVKARAAENGGVVDDWGSDPKQPAPISSVPDAEIDGDRFPLYGKRASDLQWVTRFGHTKAWAHPKQTVQGQWVFPSPDDTGVEEDPTWWPPEGGDA